MRPLWRDASLQMTYFEESQSALIKKEKKKKPSRTQDIDKNYLKFWMIRLRFESVSEGTYMKEL